MEKFKIGDVVEADHLGKKIGTICNMADNQRWISVCFFEYIGGHDCDGYCENGHGYNYNNEDVKLYDEKKIKDINKKSYIKMMKKKYGKNDK